MTTELKSKLADLGMFTCSEEFVRTHRNVLCSEGVMYVAENAGAYWLIDIIASYQCIANVRREPFQVYELKVDLEKSKAVVVCTDGNNNILHTQKIPYTDFPIEYIKMYYSKGTAILPSEY